MPTIKLNQQLKRVEIKNFEIENEIVFNYFNNLPANERDDKLFRALYIGVLAMMEDRISAFLAKTTNELGTELESLKIIFEMKSSPLNAQCVLKKIIPLKYPRCWNIILPR